jgi:hypothetical protein
MSKLFDAKIETAEGWADVELSVEHRKPANGVNGDWRGTFLSRTAPAGIHCGDWKIKMPNGETAAVVIMNVHNYASGEFIGSDDPPASIVAAFK